MSEAAPTIRVLVLRWIIESGATGATVKELAAKYSQRQGWNPESGRAWRAIQPRCTELAQAGQIKDSGIARERCTVWASAEG